jgi:hypothetical protein
MEMKVGAGSQINAGSCWEESPSWESVRQGRGSYQVADSRADGSADVGDVPGSTLGELSL